MGYLLSLSKSATVIGLNASEIALLLSSALLIVGLIGEYKYPSWSHKLRKQVPARVGTGMKLSPSDPVIGITLTSGLLIEFNAAVPYWRIPAQTLQYRLGLEGIPVSVDAVEHWTSGDNLDIFIGTKPRD